MFETNEAAEIDSEEIAADSVLYLTFRIEQELLALDVSRVREVLDLCPITRVPMTPDYLRGVINIRGSVIPVIDLRLRFGLSGYEATIDSRIVVIELDKEGTDTVVGILTDSVHDVIEITPDQIDASPQMGTQWRTEYISGIGKHTDRFILLLDIDRIFADHDTGVGGEWHREQAEE
jgi:purine-binding chemotaxis protein CheW